MTAMTFGYCRVSTTHQTTDRQRDALVAAGVPEDRIFEDKISGSKFIRKDLDRLLRTAREGDTIIVSSLDRLGRSLAQVIQMADELKQRGIVLRSLKESIDYSTPMGQMLAGIFAALAQYELTLIHERAAQAREAARARGKHTGRPSKLTADQVRQLRVLHAGGESVKDLVRSFGVSRATVYRALGPAA